jgi:hypothetical protein
MDLAMDPQTSLLFIDIENELLSASSKINSNEVKLLIDAGLAHRKPSYLPQLHLKKKYFVWAGLATLVFVGLTIGLLGDWSEKQAQQQTAQLSTPAPNQTPAAAVIPITVKKIDAVPDATAFQEQKTTSAAPTPGAIVNTQPSVSKSSEIPSTKENKNTATTQETQAAILKLTFTAPSWIQVVEQNGKRIEKVFTPQDTLELDLATLATLVIGNARETKLFTNTTEIDLSKYLNAGSGVARFSQSDIIKLGQ